MFGSRYFRSCLLDLLHSLLQSVRITSWKRLGGNFENIISPVFILLAILVIGVSLPEVLGSQVLCVTLPSGEYCKVCIYILSNIYIYIYIHIYSLHFNIIRGIHISKSCALGCWVHSMVVIEFPPRATSYALCMIITSHSLTPYLFWSFGKQKCMRLAT